MLQIALHVVWRSLFSEKSLVEREKHSSLSAPAAPCAAPPRAARPERGRRPRTSEEALGDAQIMVLLMTVLPLLLATAAQVIAAVAPRPVQLCGCAAPGTAAATQQSWDWGARGVTGVTIPSPIRLRANRSLCLHAGAVPGRSEPHALFVAECAASSPNFSFVPTMQALDARDTSVLQQQQQQQQAGNHKRMCVDAAGMSDRLQLWSCINDDNDQQYAGVDGLGAIVDLWTGFSNCVGVAGPECSTPHLLPGSGPPPPPPPPAVPVDFARRWCPRYHASRGTDPSGALIRNGEIFIFPDGSDDNSTIPPHHYGTRDLLTWTRYPFGWEGDTGSITVTSEGVFRMWPQGGAAGAIALSTLLHNDSTLSNWSTAATVVRVPKGVLGAPVANFRDPSRAVQLDDGHYYLAVGSDDGNTTGYGGKITSDGVAAMRLFRSADDTLRHWTDMGMPWVAHKTQVCVCVCVQRCNTRALRELSAWHACSVRRATSITAAARGAQHLLPRHLSSSAQISTAQARPSS
eukprot:COSAG01_NODE_11367_length_1951_cov_1.942765_1_plen_518_part_00